MPPAADSKHATTIRNYAHRAHEEDKKLTRQMRPAGRSTLAGRRSGVGGKQTTEHLEGLHNQSGAAVSTTLFMPPHATCNTRPQTQEYKLQSSWQAPSWLLWLYPAVHKNRLALTSRW
jgi:hypothetical protein